MEPINPLYQIALTRVKGVGNVLAKQLIAYCGTAEEVFRSSKKSLLKIPGIGAYVAGNIQVTSVLEEAERELAFADKHQIRILLWNSAGYPVRLEQCPDAPVVLYYKGQADLDGKKIISVVGTRKATDYGKQLCYEFMREIRGNEVLIVSGLAYGIDSYAHRAALQEDIPTVGVLGHGLDRIYPAANRKLALDMLRQGGLLTEYPSGTEPDKQHFPARNRIIAGLADITLVVEAYRKGGALITAEIANTYNRDVCAFPGDIHRDSSAGCNYLIKTHRAHLIYSANDLAYLMNWNLQKMPAPEGKEPELGGDPLERRLYDQIRRDGPVHVDQLSQQTGIFNSQLAMLLLQLEIKGLVIGLPGKRYRVA